MELRPVDATLLADVGELFGASSITRGCHCMWFLLTSKEMDSGWSGANRERFERFVAASPAPAGVLAYDDDGRPVGWCAAGPRSRYGRVLRSPLMKGHDDAEDDDVWFVPCFFVRPGARRAGLTRELLAAAVAMAREHGAAAVEGFPLAGPGPHRDDRYLGTEGLFAACGFAVTARPSPRRVVMRLALT
ncbi:N-acetyltransferase family protein [Actinoplanes sp. CA-030573]|uniref:GNAT family N-acetyltransferase n=1 Tax=Actinoplanes sp. CA-030573 TaxID=3239898 RepID=UPI003D8D52C0